jgi:predicted enzyme related to lactoylglutathione lyase
VGDYLSELGVTDRKLAPDGLGTGPAGSVTYWQVDDVPAAFDRLPCLGAKPLQPPTELSRGFMIASVMDPFGSPRLEVRPKLPEGSRIGRGNCY